MNSVKAVNVMIIYGLLFLYTSTMCEEIGATSEKITTQRQPEAAVGVGVAPTKTATTSAAAAAVTTETATYAKETQSQMKTTTEFKAATVDSSKTTVAPPSTPAVSKQPEPLANSPKGMIMVNLTGSKKAAEEEKPKDLGFLDTIFQWIKEKINSF